MTVSSGPGTPDVTGSALALTRYNADGTPDGNFGSGGNVTILNPTLSNYGGVMAL